VSARELTGTDLIAAIGAVTGRPAVDKAVHARAEQLAAAIAARAGEGSGIAATVRHVGLADYAVEVSGPGLRAREFGSLEGAAEPIVGPAVDAAKG
jgi:hypothetical protein